MPLYVRTLLLTASPDEAATAREGHLQHLRELRREGKLRHAGELGEGEGFLEVFEAKDLHEAESITRSSPLVEEGLGSWTLRRWEEQAL
jgi:uncharacterized protein YciI